MDERRALMDELYVSLRLDLIGYLCPVPVAETRKALAQMPAGEVLELIADDLDVKYDIPALVKRIGAKIISSEETDGTWRFHIMSERGEDAD